MSNSGHAVAYSTKHICITVTSEVIMTSYRTETETVLLCNRMKKVDHSIIVAAISQCRRSLSVSGSRWTFKHIL